MDRVVLCDLYDIYKELLTDREKEVFEFYYMEDLSLKEIADDSNVSRSAIFNVLKNVEDKLSMYENKLLIYKNNKILEQLLESDDINYIKDNINKIIFE